MTLYVLLGLPLLAFVVSAAAPRSRHLPAGATVVGASVALALAARAAVGVALGAPLVGIAGWLSLDGLGALVLLVVALVGACAALFSLGYMGRHHGETGRTRSYYLQLDLFLFSLLLVPMASEPILAWIAVELTALLSVFLVGFESTHAALEAAWKYIVMMFMGAAIALLGFLLLFWACTLSGGAYSWEGLRAAAPRLSPALVEGAFLLILVGFGTKVGLVPLHTWLPDAHSESPSVISALLSGALLNCAFLGILRSYQICAAAGQSEFCRDLLVLFGLMSIGWATVFILGQTDYKRMLAYSSVEHVGILALGVGIGAGATFGAMLHAVNHSLTKAMLFMAAGNILAVYKTKTTTEVRGVLRVLPVTGVLWIAGFVAITGMPPFGMFVSEFTLLRAMIKQGKIGIAVAFLAMLALIFVGMSVAFLNMAQGKADKEPHLNGKSESVFAVLPPMVLGALTLMLGLYIPTAVKELLHGVAAAIGGY